MSILNVNKINPVGGGSTITIAGIASVTNNISVGNSVTAGSFVGPIEGAVTGNVTGNADTASGLSGNPSINTTGIVTATSFVPTVGQLSHRNLIINGDMRIAQRATTSTTAGVTTIDRFKFQYSGTDEAPTASQVDVTSGGAYDSGFRKCFKVTNGNQTGGAGTSDMISVDYHFETQDISYSGWNYVSSSSFITLSYWVKSSVSQNFYGRFQTIDGTGQNYPFETGTLTANTWTKITKTIPGNSNLQFDTSGATDLGFILELSMFRGTDKTGTIALDAWNPYGSGTTRTPDQTSTWYTTNDATFEITGVQFEVGPTATPFEHRSFGDELQRCRRYYQVLVDQAGTSSQKSFAIACAYTSSSMHSTHLLSPEMRTVPTLDYTTGTDYYRAFSSNAQDSFNDFTLVGNSHANAVDLAVFNNLSVTQGSAVLIRTYNGNSKIAFTAEL